MDTKQVKQIAGKEVNKHEKKMHPGKPVTKFAKGGKTNAMMRTYGRGMAKVMNQRSGG